MLRVTREDVQDAYKYYGMVERYGSDKTRTVFVLKTDRYEESVLCYDVPSKKWYEKNRDSFYDYFESGIMLTVMQVFNEADAMKLLEEADAFEKA